ncbi:hypothetical protein JoomaDRAFT_1379 [Galbibacter orientalis DSM 19592]|uniref:Deoxyuridine 5'-triphosphate nucleotidohydrolase n=1 Tax=Galbibacter orientalis DSM 19592 TaxID=926559 RepID=I3C451_9FLAO|nr:DUF4292 domain-containing protein [Galbibacter orientalis]EIJ38394.1 hypothetical protein JoomaDRAFT_1379 [Galbibacter orientalis DSM 19592]
MNIIRKTSVTIFATILLFTTSCGSKNVLGIGELKSNLSAKNIIGNHYKNELDFETLTGRIKIDYSDGENSQGTTVSIRMKKDEAIWMSATLSVVKVLITPTRVSFYNKLDNTYFDGDFSYLNKLLGTELNFEMVQNLLLGQAVFDLNKEPYYASSVANKYQLKPEKQSELFKTLFLLEPTYFKMSLQQISQPSKNRLLSIDYKNYQTVDGKILPNEIEINAVDKEHKNRIEIEYNSVEFNRDVSFPYSIPSGFKQVEIK